MNIDHDLEAHRFTTRVPSGTALLAYVGPREGVLEVYRTYVPPPDRGKQVAGALVDAALAYARAEGLRVVPTCWYVALWIQRHPEHADLVAAPNDG
jgi:uncharacterized protein